MKREKMERVKEIKEKAKMEKENPKSRATTLQRPKMDAIKDNNVPGIIED